MCSAKHVKVSEYKEQDRSQERYLWEELLKELCSSVLSQGCPGTLHICAKHSVCALQLLEGLPNHQNLTCTCLQGSLESSF